jgi:hypothetical protein
MVASSASSISVKVESVCLTIDCIPAFYPSLQAQYVGDGVDFNFRHTVVC